MSEALSAAPFVARFKGLAAQLPGDAAWRARAAAHFAAAGLPGPGREAWKYTSLRGLAETRLHEPLTEAPSRGRHRAALPAHLALPDCPRAVFVEGRYDPELSTLAPDATFRRFATEGVFDRLAPADGEPLVSLNTMLAEDGAIFDIPAESDGGTRLLLSLGSALGSTAVDFHPRHRIRLGARARLTLIEIATGSGAYLHNPVTEIRLGEGAALTHWRLQAESEEAFHLASIYARLDGGARYATVALNCGARTGRTEYDLALAGPNATLEIDAAQALFGTSHGDVTSIIRHEAPQCRSRQTVRNVLGGRARGVFQGRIDVARGAQKTDGYQMNQALLLSPQAEMDSKPELRIFADDVKCSHGATIGELDSEQLFYLRSRGVPHGEARRILIRAFLDAALADITDDIARALFEHALDARLEGALETAP